MIQLKELFDNWIVDEDNEYDISEVRALFFFRQWKNDFEGANGRIASLKEHLESKIKNTKVPTVIIDWGGVQEKYIYPHFRKEDL